MRIIIPKGIRQLNYLKLSLKDNIKTIEESNLKIRILTK